MDMETPESQGGVFSRRQALEAGASESSIDRALRSGRINRQTRGVYRIAGAPLSRVAQMHAAIAGAGSPRWISHLTAAELHGLATPRSDLVEITRRQNAPRLVRPGVLDHSAKVLPDTDLTVVSGIPATSVARTLIDCSEHLNRRELATAVDDALRRKLVSIEDVAASLQRLGRYSGRKRVRDIRKIVIDRSAVAGVESLLEARVLRAIKRAGLPLPETQYWVEIGGHKYRLDFAYPQHMIALEADGYAYHSSQSKFEADRTRDNRLRLAGWTVLHFTAADSSSAIAAAVRSALCHQLR